MNIKLVMMVVCFLLMVCDTTVNTEKQNVLKKSKIEKIGDIKILYLYGNHANRGYQHGYHCGSMVKESFEDILLLYMCKEDMSQFKKARTFIKKHFHFEQKYIDEAQGIIDGMVDRGVSLDISMLNRKLDFFDILMLSSIEELYNIVDFKFGCSSISSWGRATEKDTLLKGELVITRHWDYPEIKGMIKNLMVIVHMPDEVNESPWVNCSWAGMIGTCSAMSIQKVGAFLDYGDYTNEKIVNLKTHHPVALSIRNGIELKDFNKDGVQSPMDVYNSVEEYIPYFGSLIHAVTSIKLVNNIDKNPLIIESENIKGFTLRTHAHNVDISGDNLALTNHYRNLYPPITCHRYKNMIDSLDNSSEVSFNRSWDLLAGAGATRDCAYSLTYVPDKGILRIAVKTMEDMVPAYERESVVLRIDKLFNQ